ncbi:MAG: substrate-binding domain-containing protein [Christensenellales bacterium]|jgi:LacI family transcriptional regulator
MAITIKTIADLVGVSHTTVYRVVNGHPGVKPELREKIIKIATDLDYRPNTAARALRAANMSVKIGFLMPSFNQEFNDQVKEGIEAARDKYKNQGVEIIVREMPEYTPEVQISMMNELAAEGVKGLSINPIDCWEVRMAIDKLARRKIPVVAYNSDILGSKRICFVGPDNVVAGKVAASLVGKVRMGAGNILLFSSNLQLLCSMQRIHHFKQLISERYPQMQIVDEVSVCEDDETAYNETKKALQQHPQIDVIYINGGGGAGVVKCLKELRDENDILYVGHDLLCGVLTLTKDTDYVDFLIAQAPFKQGLYPVKVLVDYLLYDIPPAMDTIAMPVDIRMRYNMHIKEYDLT